MQQADNHNGVTEVVRCADCSTIIAEVWGKTLVIRSAHHGRKHTTAIVLHGLDKIEKASVG